MARKQTNDPRPDLTPVLEEEDRAEHRDQQTSEDVTNRGGDRQRTIQDGGHVLLDVLEELVPHGVDVV